MKARINLAMAFLAIIFSASFIAAALAMDTDLWQLPELPSSTIIWKDQPMELNQIKANATHLRTDLSPDKVVDFYKTALQAQGWKLGDKLTPEISTFIKKDKFIYVYVFSAQVKLPRDVYLIASPAPLTICDTLKDYFLREQLMPDTEGRDLIDVPRYPGSRRRLDVFFPQALGILIYEAQASPQEIARFFRQEMKAFGWREELALAPGTMQKINPVMKDTRLLIFYRGKESVFFNIMLAPKSFPAAEAKAKGRSLITITRNTEKTFRGR